MRGSVPYKHCHGAEQKHTIYLSAHALDCGHTPEDVRRTSIPGRFCTHAPEQAIRDARGKTTALPAAQPRRIKSCPPQSPSPATKPMAKSPAKAVKAREGIANNSKKEIQSGPSRPRVHSPSPSPSLSLPSCHAYDAPSCVCPYCSLSLF